MASKPDTDKQQAHELIERLSPGQVKAVARLLEEMLDPVARAIANAPADDEPETEQERQGVAESKKWFERHSGEGTSHEEVLADFNLPLAISRNTKLSDEEDCVVRARAGRRAPVEPRQGNAHLRGAATFCRNRRRRCQNAQRESRELRLRIGDYRVRFTEGPNEVLQIHSVRHRKEAYR